MNLDEYFRGCVGELERRAAKMLESIPRDLERDYDGLIRATNDLISGELEKLRNLRDYAYYNLPENQPARFRGLKRCVRELDAIEVNAIAALERRHPTDDRMNKLVYAIKGEIGYPLLAPIVSPFARKNFEINMALNIVFVPLLERHFLLHLPDLYHELGHALQYAEEDPKVAPLLEAKAEIICLADAHFSAKRRESISDGMPEARTKFYEKLEKSWTAGWIEEFICDIYAVAVLGPAFAWSHLHLCAKRGGNPFFLPVEAVASHPADHARMMTALDTLGVLRHGDICSEIGGLWEEFLRLGHDRLDPAFDEAYPPKLMRPLVDLTLSAIEQMGGRFSRPGAAGRVRSALNEAWVDFWRDPAGYANREGEIAETLDRVLST